jgi:hypothetical protein
MDPEVSRHSSSSSVHDQFGIMEPEGITEMKSRTLVTLVCAVLSSAAAEKHIQRKDLPPKVEQSVEARSTGATIRGFTQETEHGKTIFEVEMTVNDRSRDVSFDAEGNLVGIEEEVPLDSIPGPARAAIEKVVSGANLRMVEKVTEGSVVSYEATYKKGGKSRQFRVAADGSPLKGD